MIGQVTIQRFDPQKDAGPYRQEYTFRYEEGMSVLNVLNQIHEEQDPALSYSYCCKAVKCGMCGVMLNGVPCLTCEQPALPRMTLEPLRGFPVVKDLVTDRAAYEEKRPALRLYLERATPPERQPEPVDMDRFAWFKRVSRCIECYSCLTVCPVYQKKPLEFAGPCAFTLEARQVFDPRDGLDRAPLLEDLGIGRCLCCGRCSSVCPMDAGPMEAIIQMKNGEICKNS